MPITIEDWLPMSPRIGPPLPKWLGIIWPWYKEEVPTPPGEPAPPELPPIEPTLGGHVCPYCDQSFDTLRELIDHVATAHPDKPPLSEITVAWE